MAPVLQAHSRKLPNFLFPVEEPLVFSGTQNIMQVQFLKLRGVLLLCCSFVFCELFLMFISSEILTETLSFFECMVAKNVFIYKELGNLLKKEKSIKKPNALSLIQIVLAVDRAFHVIRNKKLLLKFQQFLQISFE